MTTPRRFHTATLLADGRSSSPGEKEIDPPVFSQPLSRAEIYDPGAGRFTATGNMTRARLGHRATLLANGKVLIAGGTNDNSAELYDPNSGTFKPTGNMIPAGLPTGLRIKVS